MKQGRTEHPAVAAAATAAILLRNGHSDQRSKPAASNYVRNGSEALCQPL